MCGSVPLLPIYVCLVVVNLFYLNKRLIIFSGSVIIHHYRRETWFTPVLQFRASAMLLLLIILNLKCDCRNSNGIEFAASFVKVGEAHIISYRST
jgi:hypothetical protein